LADEFGVSRRTAYDDCRHLRTDLRAPIAFEVVRDGWYYTEPTFALPLVYLTGDQAASVRRALLTAVEYLGDDDAAPLQALVAHLEAGNRAAFTRTVGKEIVTIGGAIRLTPSANVPRERLDACCAAISERRKLTLRYHGAHRGAVTDRVVRPYHLHIERGEHYLLAHCELRDDIRTFLLGRIEQMSVGDDIGAFAIPKDFDAPALLRQGFHLQHGGSPTTVRVRFDAYQARWIRERCYHDSQTVEPLPDGGLVLTLRVAGLEEVKRWVMGFGSHAELLAPLDLRREIAAEAAQVQKNHEK
jgi:predicted DNA-binding transcriptional regulator YafY